MRALVLILAFWSVHAFAATPQNFGACQWESSTIHVKCNDPENPKCNTQFKTEGLNWGSATIENLDACIMVLKAELVTTDLFRYHPGDALRFVSKEGETQECRITKTQPPVEPVPAALSATMIRAWEIPGTASAEDLIPFADYLNQAIEVSCDSSSSEM